MYSLPIDSIRTDFVSSLKNNDITVVNAGTGSGKSLGLPGYTFIGYQGICYCTVPLRAAAIGLYQRQSEFLQEYYKKNNMTFPSHYVGSAQDQQTNYIISKNPNKKMSDSKTGKVSQIVYMTEGHALNLFLRYCFSNNEVKDCYFCDVLMLDEFHNASINLTFIFELWKKLRNSGKRYPKLVISSATPDKSLYENLSYNELKVESQIFPIEYIYYPSDGNILVQAANIAIVENDKLSNIKDRLYHILIFVSGKAEIEQVYNILAPYSKNFKIIKASSGIDEEEIRSLFEETDQRKIIIATNVAETSITIPYVSVVIDTLKEKVARTNNLGGLHLVEEYISKNSAKQRAGRTGRTNSGKVFRLLSEEQFNELNLNRQPEIERAPIFTLILKLIHYKLNFEELFPKIDIKRKNEAIEELKFLRAIENEEITSIGKFIDHTDLAPRLSAYLYYWNETKQKKLNSEINFREIIGKFLKTRKLNKIKSCLQIGNNSSLTRGIHDVLSPEAQILVWDLEGNFSLKKTGVRICYASDLEKVRAFYELIVIEAFDKEPNLLSMLINNNFSNTYLILEKEKRNYNFPSFNIKQFKSNDMYYTLFINSELNVSKEYHYNGTNITCSIKPRESDYTPIVIASLLNTQYPSLIYLKNDSYYDLGNDDLETIINVWREFQDKFGTKISINYSKSTDENIYYRDLVKWSDGRFNLKSYRELLSTIRKTLNSYNNFFQKNVSPRILNFDEEVLERTRDIFEQNIFTDRIFTFYGNHQYVLNKEEKYFIRRYGTSIKYRHDPSKYYDKIIGISTITFKNGNSITFFLKLNSSKYVTKNSFETELLFLNKIYEESNSIVDFVSKNRIGYLTLYLEQIEYPLLISKTITKVFLKGRNLEIVYSDKSKLFFNCESEQLSAVKLTNPFEIATEYFLTQKMGSFYALPLDKLSSLVRNYNITRQLFATKLSARILQITNQVLIEEPANDNDFVLICAFNEYEYSGLLNYLDIQLNLLKITFLIFHQSEEIFKLPAKYQANIGSNLFNIKREIEEFKRFYCTLLTSNTQELDTESLDSLFKEDLQLSDFIINDSIKMSEKQIQDFIKIYGTSKFYSQLLMLINTKKIAFPYTKLTEFPIAEIVETQCPFDLNPIFKLQKCYTLMNSAFDISDNFTSKNRAEISLGKNFKSPLIIWHDRNHTNDLVNNALREKGELSNESLYLSLKKISFWVKPFSVLLIREFLKKYNISSVLDLSINWGEILIASSTSGVENYVGFEHNIKLKKKHEIILKSFPINKNKLIYVGSEKLTGLTEQFDAIFFSPLNFDEKNFNKSQNYPDLFTWLKQYIIESINRAEPYLKNEKYLILNFYTDNSIMETILLYIFSSFKYYRLLEILKDKNVANKIIVVLQKTIILNENDQILINKSIDFFNKKYSSLKRKDITLQDFQRNYIDNSTFLTNLENDLGIWLQNLDENYIVLDINNFFYIWPSLKLAERKRFFKLEDYSNTGKYLEKNLLSNDEYFASSYLPIIETVLGKFYLAHRDFFNANTISIFEFWQNPKNRSILVPYLSSLLKSQGFLNPQMIDLTIRSVNGISFEPLMSISALASVFKFLNKSPRVMDLFIGFGESLFASLYLDIPYRGFNSISDYSKIIEQIPHNKDISINKVDFKEFNPNIILIHGSFPIDKIKDLFFSVNEFLTKDMKILVYYRDNEDQLIDSLHSQMLLYLKYEGFIPVLFSDNKIRPIFVWIKE